VPRLGSSDGRALPAPHHEPTPATWIGPATRQLAPGTSSPPQPGQPTLDSPVPATLVRPLQQVLHTDISNVPVRRGSAVSRDAHYLGARGYTEAGVVHLPDEVGALDGHDAAPLLAHELTHAAQQRRFGAALPTPETAHGAQLESDAVAVENWVAGGAITEPPPVRGHLDQTQLASVDLRALWTDADDMPVLDARREAGTEIEITDEDRQLPDVSAGGLMGMYQDLVDGWDFSKQTTAEKKPATAKKTLDELCDAIADNPPRRWLDLDDIDHFDEIANRLYNHLLSRLRFDVLVERERSGTLMDFG
jgi:hypothetical protein